MADTGFRSDSGMTMEHHEAWVTKQALATQFFGRFVGNTDRDIIQTKHKKTKKGDKMHFKLRMKLTGGGRTDDQTMEGHEESMQFFDYSTTLHKRRNAVITEGEMSDMRTVINIVSEMTPALIDWLRDMIEDDTMIALSGLANPSIIDDDQNVVAAVSPSTNRKWFGGQTTGGVLESVVADANIDSITDNLFGTKVVMAMKRKAQLANPKIRPAKIGGKDFYVMLIHLYQAKALKAEAAWISAHEKAGPRGYENNAIFNGMLGIFDGVVIHEHERVITRLGAGGSTPTEYFESGDDLNSGKYVARSLLLGAQAGVHAYGRTTKMVHKLFDYDSKHGIEASVVYSPAKARWNGEDFGVIAVDTIYIPD